MVWAVLALGLIQGLTEFLPISSSGHLILARHLWNIQSTAATAEIILHLGTLLAIVVSYWSDVGPRGRLWKRPVFLRVLVASFPAGLLGIMLGAFISSFFVPGAAALGFFGTSALLWSTPEERYGRGNIQQMRLRDALWVGMFQALALWPGLSRSGTTIFGARIAGLAPDEATAFAFWLAIPATLGAVLWEFVRAPEALAWHWYWLGALGLAAISGMIAVQWVKVSVNHVTRWRQFGIYTAVLAVAAWTMRG